MKVYLAGPIFGCSDAACKDWRAAARAGLEARGAEVFDPMVRDYRGREHEPGIDREIVVQDKRDIQDSTALLVYFDHPSVGTSMEVLYAWMNGRVIVVWNTTGKALSPWLTYHANRIVSDLPSAIEALESLRP